MWSIRNADVDTPGQTLGQRDILVHSSWKHNICKYAVTFCAVICKPYTYLSEENSGLMWHTRWSDCGRSQGLIWSDERTCELLSVWDDLSWPGSQTALHHLHAPAPDTYTTTHIFDPLHPSCCDTHYHIACSCQDGLNFVRHYFRNLADKAIFMTYFGLVWRWSFTRWSQKLPRESLVLICIITGSSFSKIPCSQIW